MFHRLLPCIFVLLASTMLLAQESHETRAQELLLRSYALAQPAPAAERADLLAEQASVATKLGEQIGARWAEELFTLATKLSPAERYFAQQSAVRAMTQADPKRAYELSKQIDLPSRTFTGTPHDFFMSEIVSGLWTKQGDAALPIVRMILREQAGTSAYPYFGVQSWIHGLSKTDPSEARALFEDAAESYLKTVEEPRQFYQFLEMTWRLVPPDAVRPVLIAAVDRLLQENDSSPDFYGRLIGRDQSIVEFRNSSLPKLMNLLPAMGALDPELLEQALASRPELGLPHSARGYAMQTMTGPNAGPQQMDARRNPDLMFDPDEALAAARANDNVEQRAIELTNVARRFPQRAGQALTEADALIPQINKDDVALGVLASIAETAHDDPALSRSAVERGFILLGALYQHSVRWRSANQQAINIQSAFDRLTDAAAGLDVNLALSHMTDYKDPLIQARLLVRAAGGIVRQAEIGRNRQQMERARKNALERFRAGQTQVSPR